WMIRSIVEMSALQFAGGIDGWCDFVAVEELHLVQRAYLVCSVHCTGLAPGGSDKRLVVTLADSQGAGGGFEAQARQSLGDSLAIGIAGFFDCLLEGVNRH